jgi:hypothetical protein
MSFAPCIKHVTKSGISRVMSSRAETAMRVDVKACFAERIDDNWSARIENLIQIKKPKAKYIDQERQCRRSDISKAAIVTRARGTLWLGCHALQKSRCGTKKPFALRYAGMRREA